MDMVHKVNSSWTPRGITEQHKWVRTLSVEVVEVAESSAGNTKATVQVSRVTAHQEGELNWWVDGERSLSESSVQCLVLEVSLISKIEKNSKSSLVRHEEDWREFWGTLIFLNIFQGGWRRFKRGFKRLDSKLSLLVQDVKKEKKSRGMLKIFRMRLKQVKKFFVHLGVAPFEKWKKPNFVDFGSFPENKTVMENVFYSIFQSIKNRQKTPQSGKWKNKV